MASSDFLINVKLVDGKILLAKITSCCLLIRLLNKTKVAYLKRNPCKLYLEEIRFESNTG